MDPDATLYFVTPLVSIRFNMLLDIFHEPFSVFIPKGHSVLVKWVYIGCPISLSNRVRLVDLVELEIFDFDVILGMDCLHSCFSSSDCITRVEKFQFPNELVVE